jgi:hypothetical protein
LEYTGTMSGGPESRWLECHKRSPLDLAVDELVNA